MRLWHRVAVCLVLSIALTGCQVELYSNLSEEDGNRMYAILLEHNVDAEKTAGGDQVVSISVDSADVSQAVAILQQAGYPRDNFQSLGDIFQKQGLISSPLEERVRYIYGLSQSISETLTQIDGVLKARVHVVVPEQHPLSDKPEPSSASVFIKTRSDLNLNDAIPKIKMIVQHSVEGLSYDRISVALFEADPVPERETSGPPIAQIMGIRFTRDSLQALNIWAVAIGGFLLLTVLVNAYLLWRVRKLRRAGADAGGE